MSFFTPNQFFENVACIEPQYLRMHGIKALLLDVDNTLTAHGSQELSPVISEWLDNMRANGIKMMIVSNNIKKRIKPFAEATGLGFVSFSLKPSPLGLFHAVKELNVQRCETALVGDQIFTDMYAAKLFGIRCFMVQPIVEDFKAIIKLKRALEKPFITYYYKNGGTLIGRSQ